MSSLPPDLDVGRDEALDKARWDRAMAWIAAKIRTHDAFQPSWEVAVNELRQFGLVRLNDAVQPVYDRLNVIAQIGALFTAASSSSVAVGVGTKVFEIAEADRARFAAAAYLSMQKADDAAVAMAGTLSSYDRTTGLLTVLVDQVLGTGSASAWRISAAAPPNAADTAHAARTDNPHGVTAAQIGAPTVAEMSAAIATAIAAVKAGVDPAWDTLQEIADYIASDQSGGAAILAALDKRVRVDAAAGFTAGEQARARSNIYAAPFDAMAHHGLQVNGFQQISQEHGDAAVTTSGYYPANQEAVSFNSGPAISARRVASPFTSRLDIPRGIKIEATTGAALGAVNFVMLSQKIEGERLRGRLLWGSALANPLSIGRVLRSNVSGRGYVSIRNGAEDRSYLVPFDLVANTDTYVEVTIPGDMLGTWAVDSTAGVHIAWVFGSGSTHHGVAGWQAGNKIAAPDCTNFFATTGNAVWLGPMVVMPGLNLPAFSEIMGCQRHYDDELMACQRYFESSQYYLHGSARSVVSNVLYGTAQFSVPKRASPAVSLSSHANIGFYPAAIHSTRPESFSWVAQGVTTTDGSLYVLFAWSANARL